METEQVAKSNGQLSASRPRRSQVRAELSNEMVRIYKEIFGRGPTRVLVRTGPARTRCCARWRTA